MKQKQFTSAKPMLSVTLEPIQSYLFVHPPGLQPAWLLLSLSVGMSEGLWAPPSRNGGARDASLSILCRLSSARSLSNSNLRIFSWRLFSAERIAGSKRRTRGSMELFHILLKNKEQELRRDARGWTVDGGRGHRRSRDTLVAWHHVAHAVAMVRRTTTMPKRKLPCMHNEHGSPGLKVTCAVSLWQRLAQRRGRLGQTRARLRRVDEGMVSGILLV